MLSGTWQHNGVPEQPRDGTVQHVTTCSPQVRAANGPRRRTAQHCTVAAKIVRPLFGSKPSCAWFAYVLVTDQWAMRRALCAVMRATRLFVAACSYVQRCAVLTYGLVAGGRNPVTELAVDGRGGAFADGRLVIVELEHLHLRHKGKCASDSCYIIIPGGSGTTRGRK
jgi:hypothetical protein